MIKIKIKSILYYINNEINEIKEFKCFIKKKVKLI